MRLLSTRTGDFRVVTQPSEVQYAVLSHVWSDEGEQSYQDILAIQAAVRAEHATNPDLPLDAVIRRASPKVRALCAHAFKDGFEYVWADFCCIDKTSSAEVSEAVNAMYVWYSRAGACYALLDDVDDAKEDPRDPNAKFRQSKWHTRGWTLPELIAPKSLTFVSRSWETIGTKHALGDLLEEVTGIDRGVLTHEKGLSSVSVARRMSWASKRSTTRKEDEAYALLGLFGVNMTIMYGEGSMAFMRLQEEILKVVVDHTIFVWDASECQLEAEAQDDVCHCLLAPSPVAFAHSAAIKTIPLNAIAAPAQQSKEPRPTYIATPSGMRSNFHLLSVGPSERLALLACVDGYGRRLALVLRKGPEDVFLAGSTEWKTLHRRYRNGLRCSPWAPAASASIDNLTPEQTLTRIVQLNQPSLGVSSMSELYIAHRSSHDAIAESTDLVALGETGDDLIRVRSTNSKFRDFCRGFLAGVVDLFVSCLSLLALLTFMVAFMALVFAFFLWLRYPTP